MAYWSVNKVLLSRPSMIVQCSSVHCGHITIPIGGVWSQRAYVSLVREHDALQLPVPDKRTDRFLARGLSPELAVRACLSWRSLHSAQLQCTCFLA